MSKPIRFNLSWDEQEREKQVYFAGLSYRDRLRYSFKMQRMFERKSPVMRYDLKLIAPFGIIAYR